MLPLGVEAPLGVLERESGAALPKPVWMPKLTEFPLLGVVLSLGDGVSLRIGRGSKESDGGGCGASGVSGVAARRPLGLSLRGVFPSGMEGLDTAIGGSIDLASDELRMVGSMEEETRDLGGF